MRIIIVLLILSSPLFAKYFASFESYNHPVTLVDPIEESSLTHRKGPHYQAKYNDKKQLISVTKFHKGKELQRYNYSYHSNQKIKKAVIHREGKALSELIYDQSGKLIKVIKK